MAHRPVYPHALRDRRWESGREHPSGKPGDPTLPAESAPREGTGFRTLLPPSAATGSGDKAGRHRIHPPIGSGPESGPPSPIPAEPPTPVAALSGLRQPAVPGPAWPQGPTLNHPRPIMDCKLAATHYSDPADQPVTTFQSGGSTKQSIARKLSALTNGPLTKLMCRRFWQLVLNVRTSSVAETTATIKVDVLQFSAAIRSI